MSQYENPLVTRYASRQMSGLWSSQRRIGAWRRLWIALATAQMELGLDIRPEQIEQMRAAADDVDFEAARRYEARLRHDVMAHVHAFGDACPDARGVIHLGATSCFVTDNADLMLIREGLQLVARRLASAIDGLAGFAMQHRELPCLGLTHLQPAQPTTIGKRACLWAAELAMDLEDVEWRLGSLRARGTKGATGTQASFLELFEGDESKVQQLERRVAELIGFGQVYPITGQTYSRKIDVQVLDALSGVAQSTHKAATDIRIMASRKELEEPFEESQIGSSAMPYKRNPMRSERICGLARFLMSLQSSAAQTAAVQWMERTLDDSANRRLTLPQSFLAADAVLLLMDNVARGLVVNPAMIKMHLDAELPFLVSENILMAAVKAGGDRQSLHESIRQHSQRAAAAVKQGGANDLLERLAADSDFAALDFSIVGDARRYVGRAPRQVEEFVEAVVEPIRTRYADQEASGEEIQV